MQNEKLNLEKTNWTTCLECQGQGKKNRRIRKQERLRYQNALAVFKKANSQGKPPSPPKSSQYSCTTCNGSGLIATANSPIPDTENYPHVAIIGAGIGGVALAIACLHRNIPFTLFERDVSFDARSQGYGLTLQQASKAMSGFGIKTLKDGIVSTRHIVHNTNGSVIGEWGFRKWMHPEAKPTKKHTNIHIARQSLRLALLEQLNGHQQILWNHQFIDYKRDYDKKLILNFLVNGELKTKKADLIVGADGIRSAVRNHISNALHSPLRYLNCIVILGICPLKNLEHLENPLLDSATVFQTANGNERIYMMPFSANAVMWQLSFPMAEDEAKALSAQGPEALKTEACKRTPWHTPIPQILKATESQFISGYPVYDRALLHPEDLKEQAQITLLGDAAHPMSPFKGQGANQALLDALSLAREISKGCRPGSEWRKTGIQECVLNAFETEMLVRSAKKVKDSAAAAEFLHSDIVLHESNKPRGSINKEQNN
ncbi:2-polyprenyl-6-methoxyphenol hydroxylase and related FAD-dependent oxidoreductases [Formosa agariphila KMM 3901]|uniref:2-polyprenyl-6-methoxyphenol hydroxylase and related FAD-dependent oxidoreductases n=1 Tax=Formosa agariphila (strain DSM 15362 / KCTC 12365 / LMG 23005 / KMM 3901 / M-2Alg 35-1) TaxID=1347342 RepID=T2KJ34_FORAG|nr:NAD(P)/FAD-dependent oxidoreductase [Formosa agariphila]CDF78887.1 2-polyprenyl-6-methoxyphenol hydroxylase and related FAD-dependent oxidoreductases [Formosa agariphila KMM 3901]